MTDRDRDAEVLRAKIELAEIIARVKLMCRMSLERLRAPRSRP